MYINLAIGIKNVGMTQQFAFVIIHILLNRGIQTIDIEKSIMKVMDILMSKFEKLRNKI